MQRAARRVAQENAGLRSLLARHGVVEGEVNEYLRSYCNFPGLKDRHVDAAMIPTPPQHSPAGDVSNHCIPTVQPCCQSRADQGHILEKNIVPPPALESMTPSGEPQLERFDPYRGSHIQNDENYSMHQSHAQVAHATDDHTQLEEPDCPNTADCFCPPTASSNYQPPSRDLEISCEAAASIIVEMRGDGDIDSARARLGCHGREECNVKNSTVLQIIDEG